MSTHFIFPKPKDWDTFEDVVCDVFARKYNNYNLQRYGRNGQRQCGIDIAGITQYGLLGIQCKHHPSGNIPLDEIDSEIAKTEEFQPTLDEFVIVTSADRDVNAHTHVLQVSSNRTAHGKYPVTIKFWDDVYNWLVEFPDLVYKHFTKYFPINELGNVPVLPADQYPKTTVRWPTTPENLKSSIKNTVGGLEKVEPYKLAIGLTTFPSVNFNQKVDLEVLLGDFFTEDLASETNFLEVSRLLKDVRTMLNDPFFSRELWIHLETRLTLAFLVGWIFRRVSHFDLRLVFHNQVWPTSGLPHVSSKIIDSLPTLITPDSSEVAVVLNISRKIELSVIDSVSKWHIQPKAVLVYDLEGNRIISAAHALSLAVEISWKLKSLIDRWQVGKIHLFGAMPAALATLISYHLNAICPISIYYLDSSREEYRIGGTLINSL